MSCIRGYEQKEEKNKFINWLKLDISGIETFKIFVLWKVRIGGNYQMMKM